MLLTALQLFSCVSIWTDIFLNSAGVDWIFFSTKEENPCFKKYLCTCELTEKPRERNQLQLGTLGQINRKKVSVANIYWAPFLTFSDFQVLVW